MSTTNELAKVFAPKEIEAKWYKTWDENNYFAPRESKNGKSYCIIMPPPNVTGRLHMGHALDIVTQDIPIRFKRMKGYKTLWLPGLDHAGIATQSKVEGLIWEKEKKTRHDFTRQEFLDKIWEWKKEYGGIISTQQRSMGASCDWNYFMFTMDKEPNEAVVKTFVDWYNEGLIYQSDYIVNWDPELQSAISDAEVEFEEVKGAFYHIKYEVEDSDKVLIVATTRPETLLGDTAVAVNPLDDRFKDLIGKNAIIPLCKRKVPIVADEHVDLEVGTGCLKVTPGHDFNDFEIGQRHNLEIINILNKDGTLNEHGLEWQGLKCADARSAIVAKLDDQGILVKVEEHRHQVGHGERSKTIIEPMVSKQWFVNTQEMAKWSVDAIENGDTKFIPKGWENTYFAYQKNPRNWCISRQLIWGHQIPVFYCKDCNHQWASEVQEKSCCKCSSNNIYQDPDVLDTWFSSGLWPLSTLGWPSPERMKEKQFDDFFPTSCLVTGFDIIFFWVARMMMMSLKTTGKKPFSDIYIHAIVRDKFGRKMSKSLGNGIEPLDMIEQYGADALRFSLASGSGYNRNINLDPDRIEGHRNFVNKIWNAFRFIYPFITENQNEITNFKDLDHHEKWILSELNTVANDMNHSIEEYRFDDACSTLYSFIYDKFCGYFIELSKTVLYKESESKKVSRSQVLRYCFKQIVKLLHPVCPYITEELWTYLKSDNDDLLIIQDYPEFQEEFDFTQDREQMNQFIETITAIRNLRASVQMKPKDEISLHIFTDDMMLQTYFKEQKIFFNDLAKVKEIILSKKATDPPKKSVMTALSFCELYLPLEGVIDITEQIERIQKEIKKAQIEFDKVDKKIGNKNFMDRAPEDVIFEVKEKHAGFQAKLESLKKTLDNFK